MPESYERELQLLVETTRQATEICRRAQADLSGAVWKKADGTAATVADYACQAILCRAIREAFPDDRIVAEESAEELTDPAAEAFVSRIVRLVEPYAAGACPESMREWIGFGAGREAAPRYWTLDPIDGTNGFIAGGHYSVCAALIEEGLVVAATLGCPTLPLSAEEPGGEILYAARGAGAWRLPLDDPSTAPAKLQVTPLEDPARVRFCQSSEPGFDWKENAAEIAARLGSKVDPLRAASQVKYGLVARGDVDAYFRAPKRSASSKKTGAEKIWDHASGLLLVEEAGGRVTNLSGEPIRFGPTYFLSANRGLLATNGHLHDVALTAVKTGR